MKESVWLSGRVGSFAEAEAILQRVGHVSMSSSTIWRRVEKWGEEFKGLAQKRQEQVRVLPSVDQVMKGAAKQTGRKGVAMDGAMVHLREEGWKELKVGCVFDIETRTEFDKGSGEQIDMGHAVNNSYVAHLGGPEDFGNLLWAEAQTRGWEQVYETQSIGDGARWIWNLTNEHFFDSLQTVDWYHATEHLYLAAQLQYPHNEPALKRWYNRAETMLFQGHADRVAHDLKQHAKDHPSRAKDIRTQAHYFENNKRRMQYLEFREEGYLIGSGMVESGAKQFKARFTGPGMRWSRQGIERLIPVRAAIMSNQFDTLWSHVYHKSPPN